MNKQQMVNWLVEYRLDGMDLPDLVAYFEYNQQSILEECSTEELQEMLMDTGCFETDDFEEQ